MAALYCYMNEAPKNCIYDFCCGLCEYCRNRESGFFRGTRFFHDVFHGYTHKCSSVYKTQRVDGYNALNTSICEQFNAFLKRIKASSKHMSQDRFSFYVQYFIHQWNQKKLGTHTSMTDIHQKSKDDL